MNFFVESDFIKEGDFIKESDFGATLMIQSVLPSTFHKFVKAIDEKGDWVTELCSCYFEKSDNEEFYRFETFEYECFRSTYNEFIYYLKLAIIRFFLDWEYEEHKKILEEIVKNTSFSSVLNEIDESYSTGIPLVY